MAKRLGKLAIVAAVMVVVVSITWGMSLNAQEKLSSGVVMVYKLSR